MSKYTTARGLRSSKNMALSAVLTPARPILQVWERAIILAPVSTQHYIQIPLDKGLNVGSFRLSIVHCPSVFEFGMQYWGLDNHHLTGGGGGGAH